MNFIELNINNSRTTLESVDSDVRFFKNTDINVIVPVRCCSVCGVPESIIKLYGSLCPDCAKHYKLDY